MSYLDDYRAMDPKTRAAWSNFHLVNVLQNPHDVYTAMAGYPYGDLKTFCVQAARGESWIFEDILWPAPHFEQQEYPGLPNPTIWVAWGFPMQVHSLWQGPNPDYAEAHNLLIKPRRSYDTGICRRRRNRPAG